MYTYESVINKTKDSPQFKNIPLYFVLEQTISFDFFPNILFELYDGRACDRIYGRKGSNNQKEIAKR